MNLSEFRRRPACEVRIGGVTIGGKHPVAVQSMTNTDTNDTAASVAQIERIDRAGGHIVRLTAQGRREGENLGNIVRQLRADGFSTAVVADIHFVPEVAAVAAKYVDKVRINPGNYRTSASTTGRWPGVSSTSGAIRRRGWLSRRWSSCGCAASGISIRWSSR